MSTTSRAWPFYSAVFLGSFLLFQIQPMLSKALLPGFGGSYLVWGAAMVFFQGVLLLGYAFAHGAQRRLGPVRYSRLHPLLLLLPLLFLPFRFDALMTSGGASFPLVIEVLRRLAVIAGLPFFALSMTAVLIQRWFSVHPGFHQRSPYVLYSASNLGSLLGLLTYPILVEPFFTIEQQALGWTAAYAVLIVLQGLCLPTPFAAARRLESASDDPAGAPDAPPAPARHVAAWFLLSLSACALLLAVTNVLTFDVAAVPFLWILPLSVYLGTFVLAFRPTPWFPRWMRAAVDWIIPLGVLMHLMTPFRITPLLWPALIVHLVILFTVCLACHVALAGIKPANHRQLTTFYLVIALGGFCGGMVVSWVIPLLTATLTEYLGSLALCTAALVVATSSAGKAGGSGRLLIRLRPFLAPVALAIVLVTLLPWLGRRGLNWSEHRGWILTAAPLLFCLRWSAGHRPRMAAVLLAILAVTPLTDRIVAGDRAVLRLRNYYGIYRIFDRDGQRYLQHGTTLHGRQYLDPDRAQTPTSYFHPSTPAAALLTDPLLRFESIGMTGLGTGALAAYAGEGQSFTIFEIDPDNVWIAEQYFTYLAQARRQGAELELLVGDGRLLMREQPLHRFDLVILDAFSSGSIPVHLITVEAFEEYFRTLRPGGLILLQISNRMLDLEPMIFSIARRLGVRAAAAGNAGNVHPDADPTLWMALWSEPDVAGAAAPLPHLRRHGWKLDREVTGPLPAPWTDRYSNLLRVVYTGTGG